MHFKRFLLIQSRKRTLLAVVRKVYRKVFRPAPQSIISIDKLGVPIVYYRDVGQQRNPVLVCNYALRYYYQDQSKNYFWNCVDWLTKNLSDKGGFSVWEYNFPWKIYNLRPPWVSGMAQGLGIKVFVLAYKESGNEEFIKLAFDALRAFRVPVKKGGVLQVDESDGGYWYEEYASPSSIRSYVLNGHIFALEGIYELFALTKDGTAKMLFDKGVDELKMHIDEYDMGSWTYYDRLKLVASWKYHNLHVNQMAYLWKVTGDKLFRKYHRKWKSYTQKPLAKILYQ